MKDKLAVLRKHFPSPGLARCLRLAVLSMGLTAGMTGSLSVAPEAEQGAPSHPAQYKHNYGTKVTFAKGGLVGFPDFTLKFLGKRLASGGSFYPQGFRMWDFELRRGDQSQTVSWSLGTGLIAPHGFEFGGEHYLLELAVSVSLGALKGNQVVIWKME